MNNLSDEKIKGELLPCPFCGKNVQYFETLDHLHVVHCGYCFFHMGEKQTKQEAFDFWNRRSPDVIVPVMRSLPNREVLKQAFKDGIAYADKVPKEQDAIGEDAAADQWYHSKYE